MQCNTFGSLNLSPSGCRQSLSFVFCVSLQSLMFPFLLYGYTMEPLFAPAQQVKICSWSITSEIVPPFASRPISLSIFSKATHMWVQHFHINTSHFTIGLKIIFLNTKGLNRLAKRTSVWKTVLEQVCDIICTQETRFQNTATPHCTHKAFQHIFMANCSEKKRGILIAIRDTVAFQPQECGLDPNGR